MKKLQLQNFGVREMDAEELKEITGGSWLGRITVIAGYALLLTATGGLGLIAGAALFAAGAIEEAFN